MAQPTFYSRDFSFSAFQAANPTKPLPAQRVDGELDRIADTLEQTLVNLALIQRDDDKLANQSVHPEAIRSDVWLMVSGWTPRGDWAVLTNYAFKDVVAQGGNLYVCLVAHQSTASFAFDLGQGKWMNFTADVDVAVAAAASAVASASAAATSATNASNSASAASTSASDAATSAGQANTSAITSAANATSASASAAAAAASALAIPSPAGGDQDYVRVKADHTGYERRTVAQLRTDIALPASLAANSWLQANGPGTAWEAKTTTQVADAVEAVRGTDDFNEGLGARVWHFSERMFVGYPLLSSSGSPLATDPPLGSTWPWAVSTSTLAAISADISLGVTGLAKSSLEMTTQNPARDAAAPIGLAAFALNDTISPYKNAVWAGYFESARMGSGGNAGTTHGIEIDVGNFDDTIDFDPYTYPSGYTTLSGLTIGLHVAAGGSVDSAPAINPASAAITVVNGLGGSGWRRGIVFSDNGISEINAEKQAIYMADGMALVWGASENVVGARIRSDVTSATNAGEMIFANSSIVLRDLGGAGSDWASFSATGIVTPGITLPAWTQTTPTPTAGSGTLTSASSTIRAAIRGKDVKVNVLVSVPTNGTGATSLNVALPVAAKTSFVQYCRSGAGTQLLAIFTAASTNLQILTTAGAYPASDGFSVNVQTCYEAN